MNRLQWPVCALSVALVLCSAGLAAAQPPPTPATPPSPSSVPAMETVSAEPSGETAMVTLFNRPIISLRARVLGRSPQERATAAERILDDLVAQQITGPVDWQPLAGGSLISVASRGVLVLMPPDVDALLGETLPAATAQAVARLQQALAAAAQGRAPGMLLRSVALALLGLMAGLATVKAKGLVDETRVAVTGWSYGGFMTSWLIGHYQGWRVAMAGAPVTDFVDQAELSDGGWDEVMGGVPFGGKRLEAYRTQSPISAASNIRTPTLIMSNTGDFRVPITQAYKLYHTLKDNNVETKFIAYPIPGHSPNDPIRARDVQRRWMEWVQQHFDAKPSSQ